MSGSLAIVSTPGLQEPNSAGQRGFMDDYTHRIIGYKGGWYSGKTWAGARKLADLHVFNAFDDSNRPTFCKGIVVGQNLAQARTKCIPELEDAFREMGLSFRFVPDPKRYLFEMLDFGTGEQPSEIYVRTAENPEAINSVTCAHGWGDEPARWPQNETDPTRDPFIQILGRVRDPKANFRQIVFTFTPEGDDTVMYKQFEQKRHKDRQLYESATWDNPVAKEWAEEMKDTLPPILIQQYLKGKTISLRGMRMYTFDCKAHVNDSRSQLQHRYPLQFSIDFNINPGMHGVLGQQDQDNDFFWSRHVIHEYRMAVPQMVVELGNILRRYGWSPKSVWPFAGQRGLQVFGDATGGRKEASRGESAWDVTIEYLRQQQIPYQLRVPKSNPYVADRVFAYNAALLDSRSLIHYVTHSECTRLIDDLSFMKWNEKSEVDKSDKDLSHASDGEGYRIQYLRPIIKSPLIHADVSPPRAGTA